jgi:hypothetical protein
MIALLDAIGIFFSPPRISHVFFFHFFFLVRLVRRSLSLDRYEVISRSSNGKTVDVEKKKSVCMQLVAQLTEPHSAQKKNCQPTKGEVSCRVYIIHLGPAGQNIHPRRKVPTNSSEVAQRNTSKYSRVKANFMIDDFFDCFLAYYQATSNTRQKSQININYAQGTIATIMNKKIKHSKHATTTNHINDNNIIIIMNS